jgi:hypothetical protein
VWVLEPVRNWGWMMSLVGSVVQVQGQGQGRPSLCCRHKQHCGMESGERLVRWPAFTVLGLGSRFGRP